MGNYLIFEKQNKHKRLCESLSKMSGAKTEFKNDTEAIQGFSVDSMKP